MWTVLGKTLYFHTLAIEENPINSYVTHLATLDRESIASQCMDFGYP